MASNRGGRRRKSAAGINQMLKDILEGKPLRHPIHPMLVHFPIGFFILSLLLDLASFLFPDAPYILRSSFYAMLLGVITALIAAIPGFVDYGDIRNDHPGKRIATAHMTLNLLVVAVYGINLGLRSSSLADSKISMAALLLSLVGVGLLSASGHLGGKLVYDQGIAVGRHKRRTPTPQETIRVTRADATAEGKLITIPDARRQHAGQTFSAQLRPWQSSISTQKLSSRSTRSLRTRVAFRIRRKSRTRSTSAKTKFAALSRVCMGSDFFFPSQAMRLEFEWRRRFLESRRRF